MIRYEVARWNNFLATRERGRRVREDIEAKLAQLGVGDTLLLDFAGVEGITVSFGDETLAKLVVARMSGDFTDRGLIIEGANEDVRETLESVLARRKLAVVSVSATGEPKVLGDVGWLPETLRAALDLQTFRASEIAERLGLTPQAANNRLRMLVASGAVAKQRVVPEGGGKEFSYKASLPAYA